MGRVTELIDTGKLAADLGVPALRPALDPALGLAHERVVICGSPGMLRDLKVLL